MQSIVEAAQEAAIFVQLLAQTYPRRQETGSNYCLNGFINYPKDNFWTFLDKF